MKGKDVFPRGDVLVRHPDGTVTFVDTKEVDLYGPGTWRSFLGNAVYFGHDEMAQKFAEELNEISLEHLNTIFLKPEEVKSFFVSDLGAELMQALEKGVTECAPWQDVMRTYAERLSNPSFWEGLDAFLDA